MNKRKALKALLVMGLMIGSAAFAADAVIYKGNPTSKVYHKPGCQYYTAKGCTVEFKSEEEARKAGYTPCKKCLAAEDAKTDEKEAKKEVKKETAKAENK